jgi:glucose/arabinose dehydrogenase
MNPLTAPRAWTIVAATAAVMLTGAGTALRGQNVAAPPPVAWPTPPLPEGPIQLQSAAVRDFRVAVLSRTLEQPWSLAFLPGGEMLVTERPGRIRIFRNGVLDPTPVDGAPKVRAQGLQGLMDIVLHPRFAENRFVYISDHKPVPTGRTLGNGQPELAGESTLARGVWDGKAITNLTDIFATGATGTESSRIAFGRDGMLYMTVSAPGTGPAVVRSQDPSDYAGKVIRLRDDGTVPPDNPFVGRKGFKPAIYTLGHRNGHALVVNPETGELWMTEQGPNGGDEINVLKAGRDYGWPTVSYGRDYLGPQISPVPWRADFEQPIVYWVPSIAVTGMTIYTGDRFPQWKRSAFVGGLREGEMPRSGQLQRVVFNERWEEIRREPLLRELKQRIRDVRQGPDGLLYVLTGENPGALLRLEPLATTTSTTASTATRR